MSRPPSRPRLAAHVVARRHIVDGHDRIVLCDLTTGRLMQIGPREWGLLAAADGTRDLDGIALAAAREGAHARVPALRAFLEQLDALGLLADGVEPPPQAGSQLLDDVGAGARLLEPLPGFTLHCDGSGSCCRLYASVIFDPVEAARARALLPRVQDGGARHERVFMPERGSAPTSGSAVTLRDGRCAYLAEDGRCGVHAAGGPDAKPAGCRAFPATFTDDGETVRVSVAVECACVLASVGRPGGASLAPEGARVRADLDGTLVVDRLAEHVVLAERTMAPRAAFVAWSRRLAALNDPPDVARAMMSLASAVESSGLDDQATAQAWTAPAPVRAEALQPWVEALQAHASRRRREDASWRSERDLARRATRWIAEATAWLLEPGRAEALLQAPPPAARSEAFYVRALVHGHRLAGGLPLAEGLRDRAARVVVARAMASTAPASPWDPAYAHPLALLEAMLRGHALDQYADDLRAGVAVVSA